jgi:hypothetical protein
LPPEALLPGHIPAQDARCAGGGEHAHVDADLGDHADRALARHPRDRFQAFDDRFIVGHQRGDLLVEFGHLVIQEIDMGQDLTNEQPVMGDSETAAQGVGEGGDLRAHPALGQISQYHGVGFAGQHRLEHRPRRL